MNTKSREEKLYFCKLFVIWVCNVAQSHFISWQVLTKISAIQSLNYRCSNRKLFWMVPILTVKVNICIYTELIFVIKTWSMSSVSSPTRCMWLGNLGVRLQQHHCQPQQFDISVQHATTDLPGKIKIGYSASENVNNKFKATM